MSAVYNCVCCSLEGRSGVCSCVFSACHRCWRCLKCCHCPERVARDCSAADGLDDPEGPFGNDVEAATDAESLGHVR